MSGHNLGSAAWQRQYIEENTYWRHKRALWFKTSESGTLIRPLQKVWMKGLRLPGTWQKDRLEWYTETEYTFLTLKGKVHG